MQTDSDADLAALLNRAAEGDAGAFRELYDRTAPKLLATVRRIVGSNAAAEDAVQEAYVRVWQRAGDYDAAIASPLAWMTTIARHVAIDALRRGPERVARASGEMETVAEALATPAGAEPDPLRARTLSACIGQLPQDRQAMVVLAYCSGWSREELAARFDHPVATVKTMLRRALMALKECLGE